MPARGPFSGSVGAGREGVRRQVFRHGASDIARPTQVTNL